MVSASKFSLSIVIEKSTQHPQYHAPSFPSSFSPIFRFSYSPPSDEETLMASKTYADVVMILMLNLFY